MAAKSRIGTIRTPHQILPGQTNNPQTPTQYPERRTYQILRDLEQEKASATLALDDLSDVNAPAPANGDVLTWVTADAEWENKPVTPGNTISSTAYASRPAGAQGDGFLPTDGFEFDRKGASVWAPWGPIFPFVEPIPGAYTTLNLGTGTVDSTRGGIMLSDIGGDASNKAILLVKTAPATPYTITMFMLHNCLMVKSFPKAGVLFRESGTQKFISMHQTNGNLFYTKWTNPTAVLGDYTNFGTTSVVNWFQISDDGTNLHFRHGADGVNWVEHFSKGRTDFLAGGPNQTGFFIESLNLGTPNHAVATTLLSWKET